MHTLLLADDLAHIAQVPVIAAFNATDQRIGMVHANRQRANHGVVGAHDGLGAFRIDAAATHALQILLDIFAVTRIVIGVHDVKIASRTNAQAEALEARFNDLRATDEGRDGRIVFQQELGGAQNAFVFAFGKDHALVGRKLCRRHDRLHDEAGTVDEAAQLIRIGFEIGDRATRHAGFGGGFGDRRGDAQHQALVEGRGNEVARAEDRRFTTNRLGGDFVDFLTGQRCDGPHGGHLHLFVDGGRATVERATEDVGETENVVDLVREVRTARADHRIRASGAGEVRHDFRRRVGQRHDQWLFRHLFQKLGLQDTGSRKAQEDIRTADGFIELALVALLGIDGLPRVHQLFAALVDEAFDIVHPDVLAIGAERDQEVEAGEGGGTGARGNDFDFLKLLACQFQTVDDGGGYDDGGAMLVVMEHRDVHHGAQAAFHLEAFRRLDVFQIDAAEGRLERRDGGDHILDAGRIDFDVENVDASEFLEEDGLAFHHRLGGQRADIAETENRRAVGNNGHEVAARCVIDCGIGIVANLKAGCGHTRRIGQRQVALVAERLGCLNFEFAGSRITMEKQCLLVEIRTICVLVVLFGLVFAHCAYLRRLLRRSSIFSANLHT